MKVGELIEYLKTYNPDAEVVSYDELSGLTTVVTKESITFNINCEDEGSGDVLLPPQRFHNENADEEISPKSYVEIVGTGWATPLC